MSLIDIRMDHSSITIDGYDVGLRVPFKAHRVCSVVVWDAVAEVLDGFDIDEPARLREEVRVLTTENQSLIRMIEDYENGSLEPGSN